MPIKLDIKTLKLPMNITVVKDEAGVEELIDWLLTHPEIGLDLETTPIKQFFARKCRLIQFGDKERQFVVDLLSLVNGDADALRSAQGNFGTNLHHYPKLHAFMQKIRPFLETDLWTKIGVNLWFEYVTFYWNFGIRPWGLFCCNMAERVIWAGAHSLKDFDFFSMEEMMLRYFDTQIDKELQTSFDVDNELTQEQYEYAALDVRFPHAIKAKQLAIGKQAGLLRTIQCENEAIGSFADMHVHGERLDIEGWKKHTKDSATKRQTALDNLDAEFIDIVGTKDVEITDAEIEDMTAAWKKLNEVTAEELSLKVQEKAARKAGEIHAADLLAKTLEELVGKRKAEKEVLKEKCGTRKKQRTQINKLKTKCQGKALINYDSNVSMHRLLTGHFSALRTLESTNDEDLQPFSHIPVIAALRDYREWDKRVKTYGMTWVTEWITHPCGEEGFLSPYTHRIHSMYNQLLAETGRTSSDNPNGQNLPQDKEVRKCFMADDGHLYITADMSGAELRILAEMSGAKIWIDAFNRGEDVHSICTEIIFPQEWLADALPNCAYYAINPKTGEPARQKCKCPKHKSRRDVTKTLNFGIAYGMEPKTLARRANISLEEAETVFQRWVEEFDDIWSFLQEIGLNAKNQNFSTDMFGRRRQLPAQTQERARKKCIDDYPEKLEFPEAMQESNISAFIEQHGRKPNKEEKFWLTHREPNQKQITRAFIAISRGIERAGKNHPFQGGNATICKIAMGSGKSPKGRPYLFHTLPRLGATIVKMVHDEIVVQVPEKNAERCAKMIQIAFRTAASERMTKVVMESEFNISKYWEK